ncbi:hypothetical protein ACFYXQ_12780 [Nocardia jiangxiensis]|uniref:Uncharacterized protein n=1 Tax=Nocardia jiangxiensis TaxID=282685 RepID=A0ABW6RX85_9NOCA
MTGLGDEFEIRLDLVGQALALRRGHDAIPFGAQDHRRNRAQRTHDLGRQIKVVQCGEKVGQDPRITLLAAGGELGA